MIESLVTCPLCGSSLCYRTEDEQGNFTLSCLHCGFTTTSQLVEGSPAIAEYESTLPELFKAIKQVQDGLVWYPIVIPHERGMIFAEGTSVDDWYWLFVPTIVEDGKKRSDRVNAISAEPGQFSLLIPYIS